MTNCSYLVLADIHLGHSRNKTKDIIDNLNIFFDNYTAASQFTSLDVIFIAGDLFDKLLDLSSEDIHLASIFLSRLMSFCSRYNIKLRILKGTPSHDWDQSKIAETIHSVMETECDFKYISTIHIEQMSDIGISVLYVPDEATSSVETTFKQVKSALKDLCLNEVDVCILHGAFSYQLKGAPASVQKHYEYDYLGIVKYFINTGHIHTFSTFERIISTGSFDRLAHGEEEAKGAVICSINNDQPVFNFIVNKSSKVFKTIELKSYDLEKCLSKIHKHVSLLPNNSYVRIKANKDNPIYVALDQVKQRYPMLYFSKISIEDSVEEYDIVNDEVEDYVPISITPENIEILLLDIILP